MRHEAVEPRVLGAVRFLDAATLLPVGAPLSVGGDGVRLVRNRQGLYVLAEAPGPRAEMTVRDPGGRYLPRRLGVDLPRDPDPAHADQAGSLFRPVDVLLYPAPAASVAPGWAVVRATVVRAGSGSPLGGALLRVLRKADGVVLARALSDWRGSVRGEALVAVPGIPITTWGDGEPEAPVLVNEVPVTLEAFVDPAFDPLGPAPDPDRLESLRGGLPSASAELRLASGRTEKKTLTVAMP